MQERPYKVYAKVDEKGRIVEIRSDAFDGDTDGLVLLGEGWDDRYHHAQGNFLPGPLMDERGIYRYKWENGSIKARRKEEMDADWEEPVPVPSNGERISTLEEALEMILTGVTE